MGARSRKSVLTSAPAAVLAAAAIALAGCGDDDDEPDTTAGDVGATEISTAPTTGIAYEDVAGSIQRAIDESSSFKGASFSCPPKEDIKIGDTLSCELTLGGETGTLDVEVVAPEQDGVASLSLNGKVGGKTFTESAREVPPDPK